MFEVGDLLSPSATLAAISLAVFINDGFKRAHFLCLR